MDKNVKSEMSFLEHLEELRWHLVRSVAVIVGVGIVAFAYKSIVFDVILMGPSKSDFYTTELLCQFGDFLKSFLMKMDLAKADSQFLCLNQKAINLQSIQMAGQFLSHIKISLISGIIIGFPYIVFEFWRFFSPALYQNEKKHARGAVLAITLLFFIGTSFGYFIICPISINFLFNYQVTELVVNNIKLMSYVTTVTAISMASGIMFEMPAIIYFLSKIGVVTPEFLKKYRRHAIVLLLIISAVITPPDVFSQVLVCFPLLFLYEISIRISRRIIKKQQAEFETPST